MYFSRKFSIFLILSICLVGFSDARFSDNHAVLKHRRHPIGRSINNVFFGERRQVGFGKFVGSGDVKPDIVDQQNSKLWTEILVKIGGLSMRNGQLFDAWQNVNKKPGNKRFFKQSDKTKIEPFSPSGPTDGWFYGSSI